MDIKDIKAPSDINNLSSEDFNNLDINALTAQAVEGSSEEDENENPDHDDDTPEDQDENDLDDGESEDDLEEDESDSEDETPEEEDDIDGEQPVDGLTKGNPASVKVKEAPAKKADKAKPDVTEDKQLDNEGLANFHKALTAPLKAAGHEFTLDDPNQIRELVSKGLDYTRKMQQISNLRGIGEILREHDMLDPVKLAYAVDLANHKPEAIARLIKESGVDTFELGDDVADSYQATPANIEGKAKEVSVREIVEQYKDDENFNSVFNEARQWDNESQVTLVNNPEVLHLLAAHANNGVYKQVMAKVIQERAITGTTEPILQHYNRVGQAMFASENDGGNAQATQKQPVAKTERVVIKRKQVDEAARRKSLAPTASTKTKTKSLKINSAADIYSMSEDEFKNLDPDILRKLGK